MVADLEIKTTFPNVWEMWFLIYYHRRDYVN